MADKIRCADCEHCRGFRKMSNTRSSFSCEHPDQRYIVEYFNTHRIQKMYGFLGYGKPYSSEVSIKTSLEWCPKKKQEVQLPIFFDIFLNMWYTLPIQN